MSAVCTESCPVTKFLQALKSSKKIVIYLKKMHSLGYDDISHVMTIYLNLARVCKYFNQKYTCGQMLAVQL